MVPLPASIARYNPAPYQACGAVYPQMGPWFLRKKVAEALWRAQQHLQQSTPDLRFYVFDAYRPVVVQSHMVEYSLQQLARARGLALPAAREALLPEVYKIWAIPSQDPLHPPPHSTGAAIDLQLIDAQGAIVPMGGNIDDMAPHSHPDFYANATVGQEQTYHHHRQILLHAMSHAGFVRHPEEWWHFSLYDQLWAWLEQGEAGVARYGRADLLTAAN